jgi:hypothetical protein
MGTRIITPASSEISRILATTRSLPAAAVCTGRLTSAILGSLSMTPAGSSWPTRRPACAMTSWTCCRGAMAAKLVTDGAPGLAWGGTCRAGRCAAYRQLSAAPGHPRSAAVTNEAVTSINAS